MPGAESRTRDKQTNRRNCAMNEYLDKALEKLRRALLALADQVRKVGA